MKTNPKRALTGANNSTPSRALKSPLTTDVGNGLKPAAKKSNERPEFGPERSGGGGGLFRGPRVSEKAVDFGPSLKRLIGHLRPERGVLIVVTVMAALSVCLNVIGPLILGRATDVLFAGVIGAKYQAVFSKEQVIDMLRLQGRDDYADMILRLDMVPGQGIQFDKLGSILLVALGVYVISAILLLTQGWLLNNAIQRTMYTMRKQVADKIQRLPLSYFDHSPRGELLSRVTNDIDNVSQTMQQTMSQVLRAILALTGVTFMMFFISPLLALIAVVTIPVSILIVAVIGKQSQRLFAKTWKSTGELNAEIEESFTGHEIVKVFGRTPEARARFAEHNTALFKASFGAHFVSGIIPPIMFLIGNLNYVIIAVLGGLRVASGQMNLGDVQAFMQYSRMFSQPLTQVASMVNLLQSGVASAERVFEVLDEEEQVPEAEGSLKPTRGRIEFEHIKFSYDPANPLIEDLSLVCEPGSTIAIVGPTGAGKTTLVNLIMRFYELDDGKITLDGVDISSVPRDQLRRNVAMVLQDTWLFHGSIRDNIAYGRPDATDEEIHAAATATYVDRFVHSLPNGYDTVIDEEGSNVSAGEKQLITIARAFLTDPALLILDEATSSVDTRTELLLQRAMSKLRAGRTSFVIAHRLSTIRHADLILVMNEGAIVEQGTHAELLAAGGAYSDLYRSQFSAAVA